MREGTLFSIHTQTSRISGATLWEDIHKSHSISVLVPQQISQVSRCHSDISTCFTVHVIVFFLKDLSILVFLHSSPPSTCCKLHCQDLMDPSLHALYMTWNFSHWQKCRVFEIRAFQHNKRVSFLMKVDQKKKYSSPHSLLFECTL